MYLHPESLGERCDGVFRRSVEGEVGGVVIGHSVAQKAVEKDDLEWEKHEEGIWASQKTKR